MGQVQRYAGRRAGPLDARTGQRHLRQQRRTSPHRRDVGHRHLGGRLPPNQSGLPRSGHDRPGGLCQPGKRRHSAGRERGGVSVPADQRLIRVSVFESQRLRRSGLPRHQRDIPAGRSAHV